MENTSNKYNKCGCRLHPHKHPGPGRKELCEPLCHRREVRRRRQPSLFSPCYYTGQKPLCQEENQNIFLAEIKIFFDRPAEPDNPAPSPPRPLSLADTAPEQFSFPDCHNLPLPVPAAQAPAVPAAGAAGRRGRRPLRAGRSRFRNCYDCREEPCSSADGRQHIESADKQGLSPHSFLPAPGFRFLRPRFQCFQMAILIIGFRQPLFRRGGSPVPFMGISAPRRMSRPVCRANNRPEGDPARFRVWERSEYSEQL